ncbi:hypothetical protein [Cylindrospermum sp. FACHB-282]|nr:hypothetical protein [Cylindrospermum sp. FACHB-282]MBD2384287.1 hypothetical protein [Cylindrospermum sp. FACHB-282]
MTSEPLPWEKPGQNWRFQRLLAAFTISFSHNILGEAAKKHRVDPSNE